MTALGISVKDFGAVGDGRDDTIAIQNAIDAADATTSTGAGGEVVLFPPGTYGVYAQLTVHGSVKLRGAGATSSVLRFYGCAGVNLAGEYGQIEDLQLFSLSAAGAADPKLYDGVTIPGTAGAQIGYNRLTNVFLRGWSRCIEAKYAWNGAYTRVVTTNCLIAYESFGLSANNTISESVLVSDNRGLSLVLDGAVHGEGLNVSNTVIASAAVGVYADQFILLNIVACTIDQTTTAFSLTNVTGSAVGCWIYATNNCLQFEDLGAPTDGTFKVVGCPAIWSVHARGFHVGLNVRGVSAVGNTVKFATLAWWSSSTAADCNFVGNHCRDTSGVQSTHISVNSAGIRVSDNAGDAKMNVLANSRSPRLNNGDTLLTQGFSGAPTSGAWKRGDVILNDFPGNSTPWAWLCSEAGSPGNWIPLTVPGVSQVDADTNVTIANSGAEFPTIYFNVALTANRTLTLPSNASSWTGRKFRIVRRGTERFSLTVRDASLATLRVIPAGSAAFVDVEYAGFLNPPAWILTGYGVL
jgi:hypothetical protein